MDLLQERNWERDTAQGRHSIANRFRRARAVLLWVAPMALSKPIGAFGGRTRCQAFCWQASGKLLASIQILNQYFHLCWHALFIRQFISVYLSVRLFHWVFLTAACLINMVSIERDRDCNGCFKFYWFLSSYSFFLFLLCYLQTPHSSFIKINCFRWKMMNLLDIIKCVSKSSSVWPLRLFHFHWLANGFEVFLRCFYFA